MGQNKNDNLKSKLTDKDDIDNKMKLLTYISGAYMVMGAIFSFLYLFSTITLQGNILYSDFIIIDLLVMFLLSIAMALLIPIAMIVQFGIFGFILFLMYLGFKTVV